MVHRHILVAFMGFRDLSLIWCIKILVIYQCLTFILRWNYSQICGCLFIELVISIFLRHHVLVVIYCVSISIILSHVIKGWWDLMALVLLVLCHQFLLMLKVRLFKWLKLLFEIHTCSLRLLRKIHMVNRYRIINLDRMIWVLSLTRLFNSLQSIIAGSRE